MNAVNRSWIQIGALGLLAALAGLAACSDDSSGAPDARVITIPDAPVTSPADARPLADAPPVGPDASSDCVGGTPTTSEDLLNACTTAQRITHNPTLPLLNGDGSLPAHP
jgi:hypothetical protein